MLFQTGAANGGLVSSCIPLDPFVRVEASIARASKPRRNIHSRAHVGRGSAETGSEVPHPNSWQWRVSPAAVVFVFVFAFVIHRYPVVPDHLGVSFLRTDRSIVSFYRQSIPYCSYINPSILSTIISIDKQTNHYSRVFYETLLNQRPESEMAQEWCVLYGVMEEEDAAKAYKKMLKRKANKGGGSGSTAATPSSSTGEKKKKKKKRILDEVEYDAGMSAGGDEGIGIAAL